MQLTNKKGLPQTIVDAIKNDGYSYSGNISVSGLFDSVQIRQLRRQHKDEIVVDVSDMVFALLGQAVHAVLERAMIKSVKRRAFMIVFSTLNDHWKKLEKQLADLPTGDPAIIKKVQDKERLEHHARFIWDYMEAFFPEIKGQYLFEVRLSEDFDGYVVSGQFDLFHIPTGLLSDYKQISVYAYIFPHTLQKFESKVNTYALFLRRAGYTVNAAELVLLFRDFSEKKRLLERNYPPASIISVPVEILPEQEIIKRISHRVNLHRGGDEGIIPPCNGIERWAKGEIWKVKEVGKNKAVSSNHVTEQSALNWIRDNEHKYLPGVLFTDYTPGENKRCSEFCDVAAYCPQYKEILNKLNK